MPLEKLSESVRGKKDLVGSKSEGTEPEVTDVMPVVPHKVLYAGIPFFTDLGCTQQVPDATIAVLQPLDPDGFEVIDIVPTQKHYKPGQYLTWGLNKDRVWENCYFQNPLTGKVEQGWTLHVEFVGRVISDSALAKDKERIERLESFFNKQEKGPIM